jgi:quinol monooxygenase YgiN
LGHAGKQSSADYRDADPGQDGLWVRPADRFEAVPDLPWTARAERKTGTGYLVMASHLPLQRITATVRFFRAVSAVRRQLATAEGLIGYALRAKPLARDYWTLSVWEDDTALRQFMRTPPHLQVMTSLKPFMGPTKFVTWTVSAADGRPSMAAALEHLAAG